MHQALDRALMPAGMAWTPDRYVRFLRGTLSALAAVEPAVSAATPDAGSDRQARLRHDLSTLGADATVRPLVALSTPDVAAALGASYVVEGSHLGGLHVAAAVARDLGLRDEALTYLHPVGGGAGARWNAFVARLDAFGAGATPAEWRRTEASAIDTFALFATAFRREGLI